MGSYKRKVSIMFFIVTLLFCSTWYFVNKTNAYEICFNGKPIAYVKDIKEFEEINKEVYKEALDRFSKFNYKDEVYLNKVLVDEKCLINKQDLKKNIVNNSLSEVQGLIIRSDNIKLGIVANEGEGKSVIDGLKKHYISKSELKNEVDAKCKNKISYKKVNLKLAQINNVEDIKLKIIDVNSQREKPVVSIIVKGNINEEEVISPSTVVTWSDSLEEGKTSTKASGKEGKKLVTYKVSMENSNLKGKDRIQESILLKPKDTVVVKGSKKSSDIAAASLFMPSRGCISSEFGMRWGRMHNGIDIAANEGSPIYAVIPGKVIYASFEEGYGKLIKIDNGSGLETLYGHCSSIDVSVGQKVEKGDKIGKVGSTGRSTGPHVHFEVRQNDKPQNPMKYLK